VVDQIVEETFPARECEDFAIFMSIQPAIRADPHHPVVVFVEGPRLVAREAGQHAKRSVGKQIHAATAGANPHGSMAVLLKRAHVVIR
jgi:hypothetical protein